MGVVVVRRGMWMSEGVWCNGLEGNEIGGVL